MKRQWWCRVFLIIVGKVMHDELAFLNISKYIIINDNVLVQRPDRKV